MASVFDAAILAQCSRYWMRMALVVDMTRAHEHGRVVTEADLAVAIAALVAEGRLEAEGDPADPSACLVRLPG
ncbi:hypothetical protein [Caulobacter mirabilis]|uniref:Uncharacterized protein n=1 Tax=Caulobacter mirabilis TaxID=69666 RepID=A0A2D2AV23_9CAUL|nr:hypothetical protein [Caulobacter mirabilis]ATQ41817.1 hypothetical protein CSW64_05015 [Caulobacter mirabilis]